MSVAWAWPAAALAALWLSACTTAPLTPTNAGDRALAGRISLRVDSQPPHGLSAGFELTGDAATGQLLLQGPLGATAAQARWTAASATLTTADGSTDYADLDALTLAALGERVPLAALFDWLRGRPWPATAAQPLADGQPGFEQVGWQVRLAHWSEGRVEIVRLTPPAVTLRVLLEGAS